MSEIVSEDNLSLSLLMHLLVSQMVSEENLSLNFFQTSDGECAEATHAGLVDICQTEKLSCSDDLRI